jgi:hypothetical protein
MPQPIPDAWRETVIAILRNGDPGRIDWTFRARQDWDAATGGFTYEAYPPMLAALEQPGVEGNLVTPFPGQVETYEFLFFHAGRRMYGKLALIDGRLKIAVVSAHLAQRSTLRP